MSTYTTNLYIFWGIMITMWGLVILHFCWPWFRKAMPFTSKTTFMNRVQNAICGKFTFLKAPEVIGVEYTCILRDGNGEMYSPDIWVPAYVDALRLQGESASYVLPPVTQSSIIGRVFLSDGTMRDATRIPHPIEYRQMREGRHT